MDLIKLTVETNKGNLYECELENIFELEEGETIESVTVE